MTYYAVISDSYRFGKVLPGHVSEYMPADISELVAYLMESHGMELDGLYLENYKSPDRVAVMTGPLPIEALETRFAHVPGLRFGRNVVISDNTFSSLEGATEMGPNNSSKPTPLRGAA